MRRNKTNLFRARAFADHVRQQREIVARAVARLEGKAFRLYVLSPSRNQFYKWLETHGDDALSIVEVRYPKELAGIRLSDTVRLIELDGWEHRAETEMLDQVKFLKRLYRR